MGHISQSILSRVNKPELTFTIEKYFMSQQTPNRAKIAFRSNAMDMSKALLNDEEVEIAFAKTLDNKGRVIVSSIVTTDISNVAMAVVELNSSTMEYDIAVQENSGFTLVAANVFQDADDNIWNIIDKEGNRVLVRSCQDDLKAILSSMTDLSNAAGLAINDGFIAGCFVRFLGENSHKILNGFAVDNSTVYDLETNNFRKVSPVNTLLISDPIEDLREGLSVAAGDNSAYESMNSASKASVKNYLKTLYSNNSEFLKAYLAAFDNFSVIPN
jgi:hypothetical protein